MATYSAQVNPDVRFATSYLDLQYESAAIPNEVLMEKMTGELFLKRKQDNRVISFYQNNKFLHDTLLELKIMMGEYTDLTYPETDESYFVSTDYIMRYVMNGTRTNIFTSDIVFSTTAVNDYYKFNFYNSVECPGFFISVKPRVCDKAIVEYLKSEYNLLCKGYVGTNVSLQTEAAKFKSNIYYETSDASITYSIRVTGTDSSGNSKTTNVSSTAYIKTGAYSAVQFPSSYNTGFSTITEIKVTVNKVAFDKIQFMYDWIQNNSDFDTTMYDELIAPDGLAQVPIVNVMNFVDTADQLPTPDSRQIIVMMDSPSFIEYMGILGKLATSNGFIVAEDRPSDFYWTNNNAWAEIIRYVNYGDSTSNAPSHETDMDELEYLIYTSTGIDTGFTLDESESTYIFIEQIS